MVARLPRARWSSCGMTKSPNDCSTLLRLSSDWLSSFILSSCFVSRPDIEVNDQRFENTGGPSHSYNCTILLVKPNDLSLNYPILSYPSMVALTIEGRETTFSGRLDNRDRESALDSLEHRHLRPPPMHLALSNYAHSNHAEQAPQG